MFSYRVVEEQHGTLKAVAVQLNKGYRFPVADFKQLQTIELIEFETGTLFKGFSKAEAAAFIKQHGYD